MKPFDESLLTAYLDDELSIDERQLVEEHLAKDASSRALLEELSSVRQLVQGLGRIAPSPDMTPKILAKDLADSAAPTAKVSPNPTAPNSKSTMLWTMTAVLAASVIALLFSPWWLTDRIISSRPAMDSLPPTSALPPMSQTNSDQEQLFRGANPNVLAADPSEDPSGSDASFGEAGMAFDAKQAAGDSTLGFGSDLASNSEYNLPMSAGGGGGFGGSGMPGNNGMVGGGMGGGGIPGGFGMGGMQGMAPAQSRFSDNEVADQEKQELAKPATDAFSGEHNRGLGGKLSKNKDSVEYSEEKLREAEDRSIRSRSIPQPPTLGNDVATLDQPSAMPADAEVFSDPSGIPAPAMPNEVQSPGNVSSQSLAFDQPTQPTTENPESARSEFSNRFQMKSALSETNGEAGGRPSLYFLHDSITPDRLRTLHESESIAVWSTQSDLNPSQESQSESFYSEQPLDPKALLDFGFRPMPAETIVGMEALSTSAADATSKELNAAPKTRNEPAAAELGAKASDQAVPIIEAHTLAISEPSMPEDGVVYLVIPKERVAEVVDRFRLSPGLAPKFNFEKRTEQLEPLSAAQNAPFRAGDSSADRPPMLESPSQWSEDSEVVWLKVQTRPSSTSPQSQP